MGEQRTRTCGEERVDRTYDGSDYASLSNEIVEAIAAREGVEPMELDFTLYSRVDTEALETLFASASGTDLRVEFRVADVVVSLRTAEDGEVAICVCDAE